MRGVFVLVRQCWDQFSPRSRTSSNTNTHVWRLWYTTNGLISLLKGPEMCVGVVKEERGLTLITLKAHILNMQDSGPAVDRKKENMLQKKRERKQCLPPLLSCILLRLLSILVWHWFLQVWHRSSIQCLWEHVGRLLFPDTNFYQIIFSYENSSGLIKSWASVLFENIWEGLWRPNCDPTAFVVQLWERKYTCQMSEMV